MTSCVAIAVPEGIALASDSLASEKGNPHLAIKLLEVVIDKTVYGVCISGQEKLNDHFVLSIFDSLAKSFGIENPSFIQIIDYFANALMEELEMKYRNVDIRTEMLRKVSFLLCGFEEKNIKKPIIYRCKVLAEKHAYNTAEIGYKKKLMNFQYSFGAFSIGSNNYIMEYISDGSTVTSKNSKDFSSMSLNDAVEYAEDLVGIMCDKDPKNCGRPIRSATLTPDVFTKQRGWT